jgi:uncharacterized Fe-S center protein
MNPRHHNRKHTGTLFITLDTRKCKACWDCIESCPSQVIGKIDLPWHKHAKIVNPVRCKGCLKCVKACMQGALQKCD